jgi:predicted ATP-dependent serine protease
MTEGKAIYSILTSDSDVSAIVGTRVYPQIAAQEAAFPFVVYVLQDTSPSDTKSGVSTLDEVRYDIVVASETYAEASDLTNKIRTALDRYTGTVESVVIDSIQFIDLDADNDPGTETYLTSAEYIIRVKR